MQLHDQQVHLGSWQVPQPLRSRVSSQRMVPKFSFSSPSLKRLTLVWSPRTLGCTSAGPEGTARRFEVSFSAAQGLESERHANQEFQVFVHAAGSATRVLWVSQHTTVFDVCCALGLVVRDHPCSSRWTCARCRMALSGQLRNVQPREQHFSGRLPPQ